MKFAIKNCLLMPKIERCKENWDNIPFSSDHVFNGDGIKVFGKCIKCGLDCSIWRKKLDKKIEKEIDAYKEAIIKREEASVREKSENK